MNTNHLQSKVKTIENHPGRTKNQRGERMGKQRGKKRILLVHKHIPLAFIHSILEQDVNGSFSLGLEVETTSGAHFQLEAQDKNGSYDSEHSLLRCGISPPNKQNFRLLTYSILGKVKENRRRNLLTVSVVSVIRWLCLY